MGTPIGSKSLQFLVTTDILWVSAVAAISASRSERGSGTCNSAQRMATSMSTFSILPEKAGITFFINHSCKILSQIPALYGENTHSDFQNGNNGQIHALRFSISGPLDDTRFSPVSLSQFRNNVGINKIHHDKSTFANKVFCKGVGSKSISALSGHPNMSAILRCVAVIF